MTTTINLIERLRTTASKGVSVWGDLQIEAANEIETLAAERDIYASSMDRMKVALEAQAKQIEALQAYAERYRWLRDNPLWSVGYRIKHADGQEYKQWRMKDAEGPWGQWHNTHEQAIDAARKGNV